jgi:uncharacterized protein
LRFHENWRMLGRRIRPEAGIIVVTLQTERWRGFLWHGGARAAVSMFLAAAMTCCIATMAGAENDLYRAKTVVTGQGEANRMTGFATALEDVLIKVSGAQKLAGDRRLAPYKSKAKQFVTAFSYHDQFAGKPIRDEQGTRDRPYDLTVDFDEKKIDDALKVLGLKPWHSHRPVLAVFVEMELGARKFIVTADGAQSDLQRDALLAAAERRGMKVVLPSAATLAKSGINGAELGATPSSTLASLAAERGGEAALIGRLVWDDRELGWVTQWQIDWQGRTHRWQLRGVTFDEAFRRGIGGAAQVLSNGGNAVSRAGR